MPKKSLAAGLACFVFVLVSSVMAFLFAFCPGAISLLLLRKIHLYQKWNCFWKAQYQALLTAYFEVVAGTKVFFQGDYMEPNERFLMIMNHRTELDWCYAWMLFLRFGKLEHFRLVLKDVIRHVPVWGYVCQLCGYLFVKRSWQQDQPQLARQCAHLKKFKCPMQVLIYPEGTDLGYGKVKSDAYAMANGLPIYEHLLHPRTSGFCFLVHTLKDNIDSIVDMTVAYPKNVVYTFQDVFLGAVPEEIHFHIRRYPIASLPENSKDLAVWLKDNWARKEVRLEQFFKTGSFALADDAPRTSDDGTPAASTPIDEACNIDAVNLVARQRLYYIGLFWVLFTVLTVYGVCTYWYMLWYFVLASLTCVLIEHQLGGFLKLELQLAEAS